VRRVAVTGGAGFLGSHICERLLSEGYEVACIDNLLTGAAANIADLSARDGFRFVQADVTRPIDLPGDVYAVLHFASAASPADYLRLPIETLRAGSLGVFNALDLAAENGARFIMASTSEAYGDPLVHPQPESYWGNVNPVGPRSVYDEAKRFSEAATVAYRRTHGLNTAVLRIFNTYGPRMRPDDGRAIPTFIRQALRGEPLTVAGNGSQTRSICYVDDMVDGILRLMRSDIAGPINLGNPAELTIIELAEAIRTLAGSSSDIQFIPLPVDDPMVRRPDISMAMERLGWKPLVPMEEGLRRTIGWCRAQWQNQLPDLDPATGL
jgi:dTDP-glucose 4,6-dehydratase